MSKAEINVGIISVQKYKIMKHSYTDEFCKIMQANYDYSSMISNRIDEILNFARGMNFKRIGIAHCITFHYEAELLKKILFKIFRSLYC
jgi:uncharacterized metal-binding protein